MGARDDADALLTPVGSLGVLDRALDRVSALGFGAGARIAGTLVLVAGHHPVTALGVSVFEDRVTDEVVEAARAGEALGAVAVAGAGLDLVVVDAGSSTGNLRDVPAMGEPDVARLIGEGRALGEKLGRRGLVALGEVGIGNTTVAAALTSLLLGVPAEESVGRGAGVDTPTLDRKRDVVAATIARCRDSHGDRSTDVVHMLCCAGGPEFALLAGVTLGAASVGAVVVLDGLATSIAALLATTAEPGVLAHLVAGQRSSEPAHTMVLSRLGLEPLLDLRARAGEGVGAALATGLLFDGLEIRRRSARTSGRLQSDSDSPHRA